MKYCTSSGHCYTQWNLSITDTLGTEKQFVILRFPLLEVNSKHSNLSGPTKAVCYREVSTIRGVCYKRLPCTPNPLHTHTASILCAVSQTHLYTCTVHIHTYTRAYTAILMYLKYSETSLIRHSMRLEKSVRLGGCRITEWLLAYFNIVIVSQKMVRLERISDYRGVGVERCWTREVSD